MAVVKSTPNPEESKKQAVPLNMPDLFANMRVKKPETFLEYPKVKPLGMPEITDHYIKHIETVFPEEQNTIEKCWTFGAKDYEVTEDKIAELKQHGISISPSDYEWVIDIFEKTAINDNQQGKIKLTEMFHKRAPPDVSSRVSNQVIEQIFDFCWKSQREKRKNRSFIRKFWRYQDSVGEDNYITFKVLEEKDKINLRGDNIKRKLNNYNGCFVERENAVLLCKELQALHLKTQLEIDNKQLEDLEFDRLMGKAVTKAPLTE